MIREAREDDPVLTEDLRVEGDRTRLSAAARASFLTPSSGLEALQGVVLSRAEKLRLFPRGGPS